MRSIVDSLCEDDAQTLADMPAEQRVRIALRLGRQAVRLHASYRGVDEEEAHRSLRREKARGRRRSKVIAELNS